MSLRFHPPLWSLVPTMLLIGLFLTLGVWQLHRGQGKQVLEDHYAAADDRAALRLDAATPAPDELSTARAIAVGAYEPARQLLLDNQTREHLPGYHVWTPLLLAGGGWLIVDRGWVRADPDRRVLPSIEVTAGKREVSGYWRPLPQPGYKLATDPCKSTGFPRVLSYPTREQLACILGGPVADGVLLLDPGAPEGYAREWSRPNPVPPARHYAYAAQWFAFAATLLFLFIKLNLSKRSS